MRAVICFQSAISTRHCSSERRCAASNPRKQNGNRGRKRIPIDEHKGGEYSATSPPGGKMFRPRAVVAIAISYAVLVMPVAGSTTSPLGAITAASSAHVGSAAASTGSTVFGGDHLSTEVTGNIQ